MFYDSDNENGQRIQRSWNVLHLSRPASISDKRTPSTIAPKSASYDSLLHIHITQRGGGVTCVLVQPLSPLLATSPHAERSPSLPPSITSDFDVSGVSPASPFVSSFRSHDACPQCPADRKQTSSDISWPQIEFTAPSDGRRDLFHDDVILSQSLNFVSSLEAGLPSYVAVGVPIETVEQWNNEDSVLYDILGETGNLTGLACPTTLKRNDG